MPSTPYVTAAEFTAHPTYIDLDDLRVGVEDPAAQTAELTNLLLMSSAWADGTCNQVLGAHQVNLMRQLLARDGSFRVPARDTPIISASAFAYGARPSNLQALLPPAAWIDDDDTMLFEVTAPSGVRLFTATTYIAGWVATQVADAADAAAMSLSVADPTGIVPGGSYRIWEPGYEETVTVAPDFAPPAVTVPPAESVIPLATPTLFTHQPGFSFSGMPADMRLAVINYTISQLMRPDTAAEDSYPDTPLAAGTRETDSRKDGSGLVAEAVRLLSRYERVR